MRFFDAVDCAILINISGGDMRSTLLFLTIFFISIGNPLAKGRGGNKNPTPFVNGFEDEITPGLLCPWEQLNPCEGRKEVFVMSETKKANGTNYYFDFYTAQQEHIDVCMNEKDAPTVRTLYELSAKPVDLNSENGCSSPCQMLLRPQYTNRLSCHENIALDQSQDIIEQYSIERFNYDGLAVVQEHTRQSDNYFCHEDYLPRNITPAACLDSSSKYCFRGLQAGETGDAYEAHLEQCLSSNWNE